MHSIDLTNEQKDIYSGHIKMGDTNPEGDSIGFTNYYMTLNEKPFFGISGEFHYSRYPYQRWEEEIIKMKMSGINIVATYIFWIHHEEEEGVFNWEGNNNLRYFVDLCGKHNMYVILRVGPFCHGEVRNGGLPDWLFGRPFDVRSNDAGYLYYVRRLYGEIGRQVSGQFFKDGGPIIGVQLENEFMAASAPWELVPKQGHEWIGGGTGGTEHMRILKEIAIESGLEAPIYTCTGWGSPILEGEVLPLFGGYAFCPWVINDNNSVHSPTDNYLFKDFHDGKYPYACCEMGGGMQCWYRYRFIVPPESVEAMAVHKIAGGCNFIGYYMYHGGSNPVGKHSFMNEHVTPKISYDFQAPLGEFGQIRDSYRSLKLLHMFLHEFKETLCPMATVLPEGSDKITPEDTESLRYAARVKDNSGFLFLNNYQDHVEMKDHHNTTIVLKFKNETIILPKGEGFTLQKGVCAVLPFNLSMEGIKLKYSTTQLITRVYDNDEVYYFFFAPEGMKSEYCFDSEGIDHITVEGGLIEKEDKLTYVYVNPGKQSIITLTTTNGKTLKVCTLTRKEALNFWKVNIWGRERVLISDSNILAGDGYLQLLNTGSHSMSLGIFPDVDGGISTPYGRVKGEKDGIFTSYIVDVPEKTIGLEIEKVKPNKAVVKMSPEAFKGVNEVLLKIDYEGDVGYAFIDGKLINDNFCNGAEWEIGLGRFYPEVVEKEIYFYISPLRRGKTVTIDSVMATKHEFVGEEIARINSIKAVPEYKVIITI